METHQSVPFAINHWAQNCPEKENENTFIVNEVVLHQSVFDNPNKLTDFVESDILLSFLKSSMKKTNKKLKFQDEMTAIFNENIPLITTQSKHCAIPITRAKQLINNLT